MPESYIQFFIGELGLICILHFTRKKNECLDSCSPSIYKITTTISKFIKNNLFLFQVSPFQWMLIPSSQLLKQKTQNSISFYLSIISVSSLLKYLKLITCLNLHCYHHIISWLCSLPCSVLLFLPFYIPFATKQPDWAFKT